MEAALGQPPIVVKKIRNDSTNLISSIGTPICCGPIKTAMNAAIIMTYCEILDFSMIMQIKLKLQYFNID